GRAPREPRRHDTAERQDMARTATPSTGRVRGEHAAPAAKRPRRPSTATETARAERRAQNESTTDSLQVFLNQASRYALLTGPEEIELAKRIERGDVAAKDRLINSNLRLVVSQARRYQGLGLSLGDLVQEGTLGLIRAAEKFDWRKGFKFSTYATLWIRQAVQRGVANKARTIRIPVHVVEREQKVSRARRELVATLERDPTPEEISTHSKLPLTHVHEVMAAARAVASTDMP